MNTIEIQHFSRLRRQLGNEKKSAETSDNPGPVRMCHWMAVTFKCDVEVTQKIAGMDADYRLTFNSTRGKALFEMKYSEYL